MWKSYDTTGTEHKDLHDLLYGFDDRYQKVQEELRKNITPKSRILDVGCGQGIIWNEFPNVEVHGVDLSKNNLRYAKKHLIPHQADAHHLPFHKPSFDVVVMSEVIEHLDDPSRALKEVSRVIKRNGVFILTTPLTSSLQFRASIMLYGKSSILNYPSNLNHIRFYSYENLKFLLEKNGFRITKKRGASFLSFTKELCGHYIPIPRKIRFLGGDLFPTLSLGIIIVAKKI